ncbi:MAG: MBL fold metallo-hydrolase [Pseudomonadota bacterium]
MSTSRSADAAFVADESFVPTSHKGLTYPFGGKEPGEGGVMPVAPGVRWVRLTVPGPLKHINCWLIDDDGGAALVDAGMNRTETREAWKSVFAGPLSGVRVTRMIGTHFHPDHIGLAGWMCAHHDAPLWMTRGEWLTAQMLVADARPETPAEVNLFRVGLGWSAEQIELAAQHGWSNFGRIVRPMPLSYHRMKDGDTVDIGGAAWRVIVGSGHSPEHACLLDEKNGVFIAGDQVLPRISPNVSIGITEPDGDMLGEWLDSIAKLKREVPADVLTLPGHGDPFTGLHTRLDAMDREHRDRLDELHVFIGAEPRRVVDCFGRLFRRAIGQEMLGMASGEAMAHLRRLEVEGRAVRETGDDGVWRWRGL